MVLLQSATAYGVMMGTMAPSCVTSDQCGADMYCATDPGGHKGGCEFCGGIPDIIEESNVTLVQHCSPPYYTYSHEMDAAGNLVVGLGQRDTEPNRASWCEACVHADGTVAPTTIDSFMASNLDGMFFFDNVALVFAAFVVAFTVVGELKDIELCSMAVAHAGDKLSKGWRLALGFLLWMRRWVFLQGLMLNVPVLVVMKGGDALSVCLNTVAILFMCDVDNIALIFAGFIVAFTVVGELKDIELCSIAVAHAGDKLSKGWRLALGFPLVMRRWLWGCPG